MVDHFQDKFNRTDQLTLSTTTYEVPCGQVALFDESVLPIAESVTGQSPFGPGVDEKTQVLYQENQLDLADQVVRAVWGHDDVTPADVSTPPSFTILARMTKDPLLLDLGGDEEPFCYDQGYGARVTCPLDGSAPILKIVKFQADRRAPGLNRPASAEPDGAIVLATHTLASDEMTIDASWNQQGNFPYRGFWQDMRFRVRQGDDQVVLEIYLNNRFLNSPILSYTDQQDPVWSVIGKPGFEFISAVLNNQPEGASPFEQSAKALMRCTLFEVFTIKEIRKPSRVTPSNHWTYERVTERVITLVEKNGDAKFTATLADANKFSTYLDFVHEAEMAIARKEGYWWWLARESKIYLVDEQEFYELPENLAELELLRPGNWSAPPIEEMERHLFFRRLGGITRTGGKPQVFVFAEDSPNNRRQIQVFPVPVLDSIQVASNSQEDAHLVAHYYARPIRPTEEQAGSLLPLIPQHHIDILTYAATAHGLLMDTDGNNTQFYVGAASEKLRDLRRENNRRLSTTQTVIRSAADVFTPNVTSRIPLLRATQLETLLI